MNLSRESGDEGGEGVAGGASLNGSEVSEIM